MTQKLTFHMSNRLDDVDTMVVTLKAAVENVLALDTLFRFEICVSEALTNLVKHATTTDRNATVDMQVTTNSGMVVVEIFDPVGAGAFDLRNHAPDLSDVDLLAESGRGLGLIMQCADAVEYGAVHGKNRLALTFKDVSA